MTEQSEVQFGTTAIPYTILRGQRQKTVAIVVDPVEGVRVRAPRTTPIEKLDEIVHRKARWIISRKQRVGDIPPAPSPREFVSGETFLYLGRQYRLKIENAPALNAEMDQHVKASDTLTMEHLDDFRRARARRTITALKHK